MSEARATGWRRWLRRSGDGSAYSLRRRLIASILGASVAVWTASLGVIVYVAWHETSDVFDDALKETARLTLVLGASMRQPQPGVLESDEHREPAKLRLYYQIVGEGGRMLRRASDAPAQPFSSEFDKRSGFRNVWVDGQAWRVYLARARGYDFQVQVGQPWSKRMDLLTDVAEALLWPALALLALLAAFCWWVIRRLLQPIEATAQRIGAKSAADLGPVPTQGEPRELQPIVQSLNLVLGRLSHALQAERRFTADAAHELRTPLAALRMRIQLMQRQQAGDAQPAPGAVSLQSLRDEVDRCTALVDSLLALARLDPENPTSLPRQVVALPEWLGALAQEAGKDGRAELRVDCRVPQLRAHPELLRTALRTIIDNALRYGPATGPVRIEALPQQAGRCRIAVRDRGPGVPAADRARLGERFFRSLGSGQTGNGLGLSIVARIAELHGATLSFEPGIDGQGLGVVLDFPAP